mmetsp:Transcript_1165/g.3024  ORF Transcript_1165/g.3024 Transcript_1165/m.3024 type:complete len:209 (+) Transcript_1165:19-645(+)
MSRDLGRIISRTYVELIAILAEWEDAQSLSERIFSSLVNAFQRRKEYSEAHGNLGILSRIEGAEQILQARLLQSLDKLLTALNTSVKTFEKLSGRIEDAYNAFMKEYCQSSSDIEFDSLWISEDHSPSSTARAIEWMGDITSFAQKELELKQYLAADANCTNINSIAEMWCTQPFLCCDRIRDRIEEMKLVSASFVASSPKFKPDSKY